MGQLLKEANLTMDKHLDLGLLGILIELFREIESSWRFDVGIMSMEASLDIISFTGFAQDNFLVKKCLVSEFRIWPGIMGRSTHTVLYPS